MDHPDLAVATDAFSYTGQLRGTASSMTPTVLS